MEQWKYATEDPVDLKRWVKSMMWAFVWTEYTAHEISIMRLLLGAEPITHLELCRYRERVERLRGGFRAEDFA